MSNSHDLMKTDVETHNSEKLIITQAITPALDRDSASNEEVFYLDKRKLCCVVLNDGVTYFNLFTYYLVQFSYVCAFTFIDACQDYLLEDKAYYNIDKSNVGVVNGDILLYDTLYLVIKSLKKIAFIYVYGSFHDIFGRKIILVFGFSSMALSLFLYPLAGKVYPNLILVRLIFSNGICAVTTQPLLADYVSHRTKGYGGGIAAVVSGFGAIFAVTGIMGLRFYIGINYVYVFTSCYCLIVALICAFGVKSIPKDPKKASFNCLFRCQELFRKLYDGFIELKSNTKLIFGVITSTLARMNTILLTLFLIIWVKSFYPTDDDDDHKAWVNGQLILGIANTVGLFSALLFGFIFENVKKSNLLLITNGLVVIGYGIFYLCRNPNHWIVYFSISIASFGFYGLMTIGYVMVNKNCGHKARGSVMGINCLFGAIGILLVAKVGGICFDKLSKEAPFLGVAILSFMCILLLLVPSLRSDLDKEEAIRIASE